MTETPRIYVACLASYNAGKLHGRWIDANQDADTIREQIAAMLRQSPEPNVMANCPDCMGTGEAFPLVKCETCKATGEVPSAEEYAIHDFEGFDGIKLSEYEDIDTVAELAAAIAEHGEPFTVFYTNDTYSSVDDAVEAFEEAYHGEWDSREAFGENLADDLDIFNGVPEHSPARLYFDYEAWTRDLFMGDYWCADSDRGVYVFQSI